MTTIRSDRRLYERLRLNKMSGLPKIAALLAERIAIYPPVGSRGIDRLLNFVAGGRRVKGLCEFYPTAGDDGN